MHKPTLDSIVGQILKQNKDQLPAMMKFVQQVRNEFNEIKAEEGSTVAVLSGYQTIDSMLAEGFVKDPSPVSCHNCKAAHCCHQSVELSEAEAVVIAQYCTENSIPIPKKYLEKQLGHRPNKLAHVSCSACVFLKDNMCSIYPVRPSACRTYYVVTPIEFCDTKKNRNHRIGVTTNTGAELVKAAIAFEGGKVDRMPTLLLKYSK